MRKILIALLLLLIMGMGHERNASTNYIRLAWINSNISDSTFNFSAVVKTKYTRAKEKELVKNWIYEAFPNGKNVIQTLDGENGDIILKPHSTEIRYVFKIQFKDYKCRFIENNFEYYNKGSFETLDYYTDPNSTSDMLGRALSQEAVIRDFAALKEYLQKEKASDNW